MDLGPYSGFILASYAISTLIVLALVAWVVLDRRQLERTLHDLASKGVTRRGPATAPAAAKLSSTATDTQE
ncbi:heme exporter protein CcmD [Roseibium aestuarii]|uniref:Heme exporter protein D n=1 Tax=Roseibium aestuarii TaxID=2600299 RepID=A0ABW4K1K2_9HYPH|nr:heme exporter protein CcmD [Roseibium aestuarii]